MLKDIMRSAEHLGVELWVDGRNLRYRSRQPVHDGFKDQLKKHKADIINLLSKQSGGSEKYTRPAIPAWCNSHCECFHRLEVPGLDMVLGCYQESGATNWKWSRLDKMNNCPRGKE